MKKILSFLLFMAISSVVYAQNYIAISKNGNVYDEANAKYITVNQNNDDVAVIPGMVFATSQRTPGWYKVEYSPGLHAFIPEQIAATDFKVIQPGKYEISNYPGHQLTVDKKGDEWQATSDGKTFKGQKYQDILVFLDDNKKVAFSLVDIGNGPVAITYDNSVTKFF
ncbi:MAG: hypothetical protein J1F12_02270 [Muribaculaceae bacterium]|nr:hypothetical protein [Muribaculaceae bacterium]